MPESLEPRADEVIVWRHGGEALMAIKPLKNLTETQRERRRKINRFMGVLNVLIVAYTLTRSDGLEFLLSFLGGSFIVVLILLFIFIPKIDHFFFLRALKSRDTDGVPLWMSRDRIMFNPASQLDDVEVAVSDILSVASGYAQGAPSIALRIQQKTVNLMSSEANDLLEQLYILRPDLGAAA